jgi:hypothetical protein
MKRGIGIGAALTLSIVALIGPLTAQAVAYIYACVPGNGAIGAQTFALHIYNSVGTTANITAKVLARTNANLNLITPATFTIAGGNSKAISWTAPGNLNNGFQWEAANDATVPEVVRITSDQPVVVGLSRYNSASVDDWVPCLPTTF